MGPTEIIVYSKPDCCLCDQVKEQLKKLQKLHQFVWSEVNILDDPVAFQSFQYEIPVIFVNGRKAFKFHLDERRFVRLLELADRKRGEGVSSEP